MAVSIQEVEHIAKLAMIELTNDEKKIFAEQLSSILDWVKLLEQCDTSGISPKSGITGYKTSLRKDIAIKYPNPANILENAPQREYDFFKVKKVIEDE